jgi:hypothetical protein
VTSSRDMQQLILGSILAIVLALYPGVGQAGPNAEVAKLCIRYSYIAFPYKRPGAAKMSGDRSNYFKDCMAKYGNVPPPSSPRQP